MRAIRKLQVKKLRKQKGMSQSQLAKALGVTKGSVSLWERGRVPTDEMQQHLCDYFGVSFGELWGLEKGQEMPELDTSEFIPSQDFTYLWSALIAACSMVCKLQGEGNNSAHGRYWRYDYYTCDNGHVIELVNDYGTR